MKRITGKIGARPVLPLASYDHGGSPLRQTLMKLAGGLHLAGIKNTSAPGSTLMVIAWDLTVTAL